MAKQSSAQEPLSQRLRRFSLALGYALFDRKLEDQGLPVRYYYDNDVIYNMLLGFEAELTTKEVDVGDQSRPTHGSQEPHEALVRALLSCGRFKSMSMLRPHALELDAKIRNKVKPRSRDDWEAERAKALQFIETTRIGAVLSELNEIALGHGSEKRDDELPRFLDVLRREGFETFIAVERLRGNWWSRLREYKDRDLLSFDYLGPEIEVLMGESRELVLSILSELETFRPGSRIPNLYDSMALAILHQKILERDSRPDADIVRFYTHNRALNEAIEESDKLRSLLSHRRPLVPGEGVPGALGGVVRTSDYFLMRLRFGPLSPASDGSDGGQVGALEEVERLYTDVCQILEGDQGDDLHPADLGQVRWQGKPLSEVLEEFETLSLMDSIWRREHLPEDFGNDLPRWTAVFRFVQDGEVGENLDEIVEDIQKELSSKVSQMRLWTDSFKLLQKGSKATRRSLGAVKREIEDPMRDLGLVRWGYSLSNKSKELLVEGVKALLQLGEEGVDIEELTDICSDLATRHIAARREVEQCLVMSAIFWALGELEVLVELVNECEKSTGGEIPPTLVVLRAAARMKSASSDSDASKEVLLSEKQDLVDDIVKLWFSLDRQARRGVLLGIGYVLYHVWKSESHRLRLAEGDEGATIRRILNEWAAKSYEAGKEALKLLGSGSLPFAFAVNHCAYVGLVTECADWEEIQRYRDVLLGFKGNWVWNSRFEDTLGCFLLIPMEREWQAASEHAREQLSFAERLRKAERHFRDALESDFGDIDLESHMERLDTLRSKYVDAKERAKGR